MKIIKIINNVFLIVLTIGTLLVADDDKQQKLVEMGVGMSRVIKTEYSITKAAVGDPEILDIVPSDREVVLNSKKKAGVTTLTIWHGSIMKNYVVAVVKRTPGAYLKVYTLNNISLTSIGLDWGSVTRKATDGVVGGLERVFANYIDKDQFYVDPMNRMVVVYATESDQINIEKAIRNLDAQKRQILMKVEIYELSLAGTFKDEFAFGLNRTGIKDADGTGQSSQAYSFGSSGVSYGEGYLQPVTSAYSKNLYFTLNKLQQDGKAKIVANPQIMTLENFPSAIVSGEKIPVYSQPDDNGNISVEYISTGVNLTTIAYADDQGDIICALRTDYSTILGYQAPLNYPIVANRTVQNAGMRLKDGQTLLIGGLLRSEEKKDVNKIPILGDLLGWVPVLGSLVKSETSSKKNTELIITVTPMIVTNDIQTQTIQERKLKE